MSQPDGGVTSVWSSWLALALVVVGIADGAAAAWAFADGGPVQVPTLWPLWAAVVFVAGTSRVRLWARYVVSAIALAGAGLMIAIGAAPLRDSLRAGFVPEDVHTIVRLVTPMLLALWSVGDVLHRRHRALAVDDAPALPCSPATPAGTVVGVSPVAQGWRHAASPWPRADEDDPDGTLLRPPVRRPARRAV